MTNDEIDTLLAQVSARQVKPRVAIAQLVAAGHTAADSTELVWIALGGSDQVQVDSQGREVSATSGKLIRELMREMDSE